MPLTVEQILEEAGHRPPARVAELVETLTLKLHHGIPSGVETAWKQEARCHLAEIESGASQPVDGEDVSARV
jgi:hypothetical protein